MPSLRDTHERTCAPRVDGGGGIAVTSAASATAKEHGEEVFLSTPSASVFAYTLEAIFVVFGTLFLVGEYLVRSTDFFEFVFIATPTIAG